MRFFLPLFLLALLAIPVSLVAKPLSPPGLMDLSRSSHPPKVVREMKDLEWKLWPPQTPDSKTLISYLKGHPLTPRFVFSVLVVVFILGVLHAASPGQGKLVTFVYFLGSYARWKHALALSAMTAATQMLSILVLGVLTLVATKSFTPERVFPYIQCVSGLMIVGLALVLLLGDLWRKKALPQDRTIFISPLPTLKGLRLLGIAVGLSPSTMMVGILFATFAMPRDLFSLAILVSFALGLFTVFALLTLSGTFFHSLIFRLRPEVIHRLFPKAMFLIMFLLGAFVLFLGTRGL